MEAADWHTYQVLTKRAERLSALLNSTFKETAKLQHIWWGVSVENRKHGLPRIDLLRSTPAAMKFLSVEPLLEHLGPLNLEGINWVIVGGESGPGARPIEEKWVLDIRDQCRRANVAFFFKQWGGARKKLTGRKLQGKTYDDYPSIITNSMQSKRRRLDLLSALCV